jgi:hypothetical protein
MMSDQQGMKTYVGYGLFKGKGAINVKPIPATLKIANGTRTVEKEGALLFEFAPAFAAKEYDWSKKISFALDPTECAELVRFKETESVSFMHNPNLGAGKKSPHSAISSLSSDSSLINSNQLRWIAP